MAFRYTPVCFWVLERSAADVYLPMSINTRSLIFIIFNSAVYIQLIRSFVPEWLWCVGILTFHFFVLYIAIYNQGIKPRHGARKLNFNFAHRRREFLYFIYLSDLKKHFVTRALLFPIAFNYEKNFIAIYKIQCQNH